MAQNHLQISKSSIDRITRGLKALDDDTTSKLLIVRNISVKVLIVTYIVYAFLLENIVTQGLLLITGSAYFIAQAYVTLRLLKTAKYGLRDWIFLFNHQSKLSKFFILTGSGVVGLLTIQLFFITQNVDETVVFILLFITFIVTTLTDVVVQPFLKYRLSQQFKSPEQKALVEQTEETRNLQYNQIALEILTDGEDSVERETLEQAHQQTQTVQNDDFEVNFDSRVETSNRERLREQALEKLENADDSSGSNPLALTPEELDILSEEEIEALFPQTSSVKDNSFSYSWEYNRK